MAPTTLLLVTSTSVASWLLPLKMTTKPDFGSTTIASGPCPVGNVASIFPVSLSNSNALADLPLALMAKGVPGIGDTP